jgi:large subunit ribosomal protein L21
MYAVIKAGGRQVWVEPGKPATLDYRSDLEPGSQVHFDQVLLVGGEDRRIGTPYVEGVKVRAKVAGDEKGEKITVFRVKRRKKVRIKTGFRARYTRVLVEEIEGL